jgi:uncharacterized protein
MAAQGTRLVLGHGASGDASSMAPYVEGLARRGAQALAIELPRRGRSVVPAEAAVQPFAEQLRPGDAAGGHSYGGRVASLVAARPGSSVVGLVLYSYPLHPPGKPDSWDVRTSHWPSIGCPVLLFIGDSDPFAKPALLSRAVERLPQGQLVVIEGGRHGLHRSRAFEAILDQTAAFLEGLSP